MEIDEKTYKSQYQKAWRRNHKKDRREYYKKQYLKRKLAKLAEEGKKDENKTV